MKLDLYFKKQGRGSSHQLAKKINVPSSDVCCWASNKRPVPVKRCIQIEFATDGVVGRKDLRPDDWHEIWPELIDKQET